MFLFCEKYRLLRLKYGEEWARYTVIYNSIVFIARGYCGYD
jgi:hypothetical protein